MNIPCLTKHTNTTQHADEGHVTLPIIGRQDILLQEAKPDRDSGPDQNPRAGTLKKSLAK
jgi:hypothetical protein